MNYAAVARHLFKKGPIETLRIYRERRDARLIVSRFERERLSLMAKCGEMDDRNNLLRYASLLSEECLYLATAYNLIGENAYAALRERVDEYFTLIYASGHTDLDRDVDVRTFLDALLEAESSSFKKDLKKDYVIKRIPEAYNSQVGHAVQDRTAVFLQPRQGLNQAFKYMFNYLKHRGYEVKLVELHRGGVPSALYYWHAERFARVAATSKVVFVHESNELLGHVSIRPESKVVQLWHGCGVFKKIGLDTAGLPGYKSLKGYEEYPEYNYFSCVTIASPELAWVFEQFMGISRESGIVKPLGVSRTDYFFDKSFIKESYEKLYSKIPQAKEKKVILYAPTYRGLGARRAAPDELDIERMAESLSDRYILIVKHHQTVKDLPELPDSVRDSFAFDMTRGKGMDIAELMTVADVCISDYSSLVFEYSLFERPMAFFVYDLEQYIDNRGLYYDFDEITPGPLCKTTDELIEYLDDLDARFDKQEVIDFKDRFMSSCDGHSTERIVRFIEGEDEAWNPR